MMRYFLKVFKLLLSLIALLCATTFLTGCAGFAEDLGNVNEIRYYVTKDHSTVKSVLYRMNNPNVEKRSYDYYVSRKLYEATQVSSGNKLLIVHYYVDYPTKSQPYRTLKDIVFLLNDDKLSEDSIIHDIKIFGAAYLKNEGINEYYAMSEKELEAFDNMGEEYIASSNKTGQFKSELDLTEEKLIKAETTELFGEIDDLKVVEDNQLNSLGVTEIESILTAPKIRVVKVSYLMYGAAIALAVAEAVLQVKQQ